MAQSSSPVSLRRSSRLSKPKRDPDVQYMQSRIDQLDREISAEGVSPTPPPLPQQQTSTINPIPSRPPSDDSPSASFSSIAEEIKLVELERDKLVLELEVLKLRKAPPDNTDSKDAIDGGETTQDRPQGREPSTSHTSSASHELTIQFTLIPPTLKV